MTASPKTVMVFAGYHHLFNLAAFQPVRDTGHHASCNLCPGPGAVRRLPPKYKVANGAENLQTFLKPCESARGINPHNQCVCSDSCRSSLAEIYFAVRPPSRHDGAGHSNYWPGCRRTNHVGDLLGFADAPQGTRPPYRLP